MKFYLIDDDKNVLHILKRIIRDRGLGEIAGTAENGVDALTDLPLINPDIVIVDLLMPEIDGITFVKRARSYASYFYYAFPGCIQRYDRRCLFCGHRILYS